MQISLEEHLQQSFNLFVQEHDEKLPSDLGYSCVLTSGDAHDDLMMVTEGGAT